MASTAYTWPPCLAAALRRRCTVDGLVARRARLRGGHRTALQMKPGAQRSTRKLLTWKSVLGGRFRLVEGVAYIRKKTRTRNQLKAWCRKFSKLNIPIHVLETITLPTGMTRKRVWRRDRVHPGSPLRKPKNSSTTPTPLSLASCEGGGPRPPVLNPAPPPSPVPGLAPMVGGREGLFLGGVDGLPPADPPTTCPISPSDADLYSTNANTVLRGGGGVVKVCTGGRFSF